MESSSCACGFGRGRLRIAFSARGYTSQRLGCVSHHLGNLSEPSDSYPRARKIIRPSKIHIHAPGMCIQYPWKHSPKLISTHRIRKNVYPWPRDRFPRSRAAFPASQETAPERLDTPFCAGEVY